MNDCERYMITGQVLGVQIAPDPSYLTHEGLVYKGDCAICRSPVQNRRRFFSRILSGFVCLGCLASEAAKDSAVS